MSSLKKINELKKEIAKLQKSASKEFEAECVALLAEYPMFESFGWTAYTPYFNDGDPCTFSINADEPYINNEQICDWDSKDKNYKKADKLASKVAELVYGVDRDIIENIGEGKFTVTSKGLSVDDYRHD